MRPNSAKMGLQSVPIAAQTGHGSPTCCSKCSRKRIRLPLGASRIDFGGPGAPIWKDLASILSKRFHSSTSVQSISFYSIPLSFFNVFSRKNKRLFSTSIFSRFGLKLGGHGFQRHRLHQASDWPATGFKSAEAGIAKRKKFSSSTSSNSCSASSSSGECGCTSGD